MLLVLSAAVGVAAGYLAMTVLPCQWFGSNFEGACSYGVLWAAIAVGLLVASVTFGVLTYQAMKSLPAASEGAEVKFRESLLWTWLISFVLVLALPFFPLVKNGNLVDTVVAAFALAFFIAASMAVAHRIGKNPLIALIALVPYIGVFALAVIVLRGVFGKNAIDG